MAVESTKLNVPEQAGATRPYEAPSIRVMDEQEVLSAFQVTVASTTWWGM
jgi:hypothetical protein